MKATLARLSSEAWRQMKRLPGDRRVVVIAIIRAPAHQDKFGKRRSKQVAAGAGQSSAIPENEEMIDKRPMAVDRLQFGIDCQIRRLAGLTAAVPHLTCLRLPALSSSIRHGWSSFLLTWSHKVTPRLP